MWIGLVIVAIIIAILLYIAIMLYKLKFTLADKESKEFFQQNALFTQYIDKAVAELSEKMMGMNASLNTSLVEKMASTNGALRTSLVEKISAMHLKQEQDFSKIDHSLKETQATLLLRISESMRDMGEQQNKQVMQLTSVVQEKLQDAVEKQMETSFKRVVDQLTSVHNAFGEMRSLAENVNDIKRLFSNIKTKGGWGEAHCQAILDDILSPENYFTNHKIKENTSEAVEFAVKMPLKVKNGEEKPLLPIDSKFPTSNYELLLKAQEEGEREKEAYYRKELEKNIRFEAKKIHDKYIHEPVTVNFAILYLPTDGLYFEVARMPSVISDIGRDFKILIMGPSLLPALLKTISLGYITLALEGKSDEIRKKLTETLQEVGKIDRVFDGLERQLSTMNNKFQEVRVRTRAFGRILRDFEQVDESELLESNVSRHLEYSAE